MNLFTRILLVMSLLLSITLILLTDKIAELLPLYVMGWASLVALILAIISELYDGFILLKKREKFNIR